MEGGGVRRVATPPPQERREGKGAIQARRERAARWRDIFRNDDGRAEGKGKSEKRP